MRDSIFKALFDRMARDESVFFVNADVGINLVEKIAEAYPDRFLNVGIAEQNLIGVCAGLANGGYHPVAYTISNFAIDRCFEQIRDDIAIHEHPVVILGSTTGYDNGPLGPTHHMVDDWGALRALPGIEIHCPSSVPYAKGLLNNLLDRKVPAYVRMPKGAHPRPESPDPVVHLPGKQTHTLLVSYGGPAQACLEVQNLNPDLSVMIFNRLRPVDDEALANIWSRYERLVVIEDHFAETGLYSTVCQVLCRHQVSVRVESRAPSRYYMEVGTTQEYFWKQYHADLDSLTKDFAGEALVAAR